MQSSILEALKQDEKFNLSMFSEGSLNLSALLEWIISTVLISRKKCDKFFFFSNEKCISDI